MKSLHFKTRFYLILKLKPINKIIKLKKKLNNIFLENTNDNQCVKQNYKSKLVQITVVTYRNKINII